MTPGALLARLTALGARLVLTPEGTLRYRGPAVRLPEDDQWELDMLKSALGPHKAALVALLSPPEKAPPPVLPRCAVCGGAARWLDGDMWRCVVCAPTPLTAQARAWSCPDWLPVLPSIMADVNAGVTPVCFHRWETLQEGTATCVQCGFRVPVKIA